MIDSALRCRKIIIGDANVTKKSFTEGLGWQFLSCCGVHLSVIHLTKP
jgi:hypothetical protein